MTFLKQPMKPRKKLYFLHIPSTSGTSISAALNQIAIEKNIKILGPILLDFIVDNPKWAESDILIGHLGLLPLTYNYDYFTVLRDPLERLYSNYSFINRTPEHYFHDFVAGEKLNFENYLLDKRFTKQNFNMQTRYLSCYPESDNLDKKASFLEYAYKFENSDLQGIRLEVAIETLMNASWVGTPNDLNPLRLLLEKRFGVSDIQFPFLNVTPGPKKIFSSREITAAEPLMELDQIIFKYWSRSS